MRKKIVKVDTDWLEFDEFVQKTIELLRKNLLK